MKLWTACIGSPRIACLRAACSNAVRVRRELQRCSRAQPAPDPPAPVFKADPAIWIVKGPKATLYLFGTVHMMKPNVSWHTAKVKAAIDSSQSLLEELDHVDQDPAKAAELIKQLGSDPEHPLSTKISKEDLAQLDTAIKQMGAPGESVMEPLRPWLAGVTLSVLPMIKAGYDPKGGIDLALSDEFHAAKKPISGLETIDQQLHFMADMPQAEEVESLHVQLQHLDRAASDIDTIVSAWIKGDDDAIATTEIGMFEKEYPALYQRLVVTRNKSWTNQLAKTLDGQGTTFVAVGAAHLAGSDSLQKMLEARGYHVSRL